MAVDPVGVSSGRSSCVTSAPSSHSAIAEQRRHEALARLSDMAARPGGPAYVEAAAVRRLQKLVPSAALDVARPMLTDREVEVLRTWLMTDSKIACARELEISLGTVNTHMTRIRAKYAKAGRPATTKAALVARAIQDDIIDIEDL
ncbi:LuxR C-terminal-related transcriptional regulator [Gordonia malaquae]|uniref:LuxR C-terminal-related transcriptional regulator n=1 Tax=Gordonia malaquae TaxID=410332 RepID=UPI003BEEE4A6